MKFSTRARYGTRAMLDLAINGDETLEGLKHKWESARRAEEMEGA